MQKSFTNLKNSYILYTFHKNYLIYENSRNIVICDNNKRNNFIYCSIYDNNTLFLQNRNKFINYDIPNNCFRLSDIKQLFEFVFIDSNKIGIKVFDGFISARPNHSVITAPKLLQFEQFSLINHEKENGDFAYNSEYCDFFNDVVHNYDLIIDYSLLCDNIIKLFIKNIPNKIYYLIKIDNKFLCTLSLNISDMSFLKNSHFISIIKNIIGDLIKDNNDWFYSLQNNELSLINNNIKLKYLKLFLNNLISSSIYQLKNASNILKFNNLSNSLDAKKGLIALYDSRSINAGLADKIRGILELYSIAKELNLNYYIYFTHPFDLSKFLIPRLVNWKINQSELIFDSNHSSSLFYNVKNDDIEYLNNIRDKLLNLIADNPREQYHITTNLYSYKSRDYNILYNELFQPSLMLKTKLEEHKDLISSDYISISFRFKGLLGDFAEGYTLENDEQLLLMKRCLYEIQSYFIDLPANYKIFVASDSNKFINFIIGQPRIYAISSNRGHCAFTNIKENAIIQTFIDFYLIMGAKRIYRFVVRKSGMYNTLFPWLASKIARKKFIEHEFDM